MANQRRSIDELIADYLEAVDNELEPDWEEFVAEAPELRQQFARFVQLSAGVHALANAQGEANGAASRTWQKVQQPTLNEESEPLAYPTQFGHYVLDRVLGRGGMGMVYVARQLPSERRVALKMLRYRDRNDSMYQERLRREAVAISAVEHPHIVSIVDSGVIDGAVYLATELVDGIGLDQSLQLLREPGDSTEANSEATTPVSGSASTRCVEGLKNDRFRSIAKLGAEIAEALSAAHQKQVIHRDVKPSNILIDTAGHAWLTDFGLASLGDSYTELTQTGDFLGTPAYMSPEQTGGARRSEIDHRTDVYSLGATLYELATGSKPFTGSRQQILNDIVHGNLRPASKLEPKTPIELQRIIARAMATHPSDRYPTAASMAEDLRAFWRGSPVRVKRTNLVTQAIRWGERNPSVAKATLVGLALSIVAAFTVQAWNGAKLQNMNAQLAQVNEQLTQTNSELDASQNRLSRELYVADVAAAYEAFSDGNIPAARGLLARYRQDHRLAEHRGTAWHLLNALTAIPDSVELCRHDGAARQLAIANDGSFGLSAGHDGKVRRFAIRLPGATEESRDAGENQTLSEPKALVDSGNAKVFSIGGKLDALAMDSIASLFFTGKNIPFGFNQVRGFDVDSGERLTGSVGLWSSVESIAVSPSDRWIASADRYQDVVVHDRDGKIRGRWNTESRNETLAFIDDDNMLAIVQDEQDLRWLEVWDIDTNKTRRIDCPFEPHLVAVSRLSDSESPQYLVFAEGKSLGMLTWPDLTRVAVSEDIVGRIRCIDIRRDGRTIVAGCDEGTVFCWTISGMPANGRLPAPQIIEADEQAITDIKLLPHAPTAVSDTQDSLIRFITASTSGSVACWSLAPRVTQSVVSSPIRELIRHPHDSRNVYTANEDGSITRINVKTLNSELVLQTEFSFTGHGTFTPDGKRLVAAVNDGLVDIMIDKSRPTVKSQVVDPTQRCKSPLVCEDQLFALFTNHLTVYDLESREQEHVHWLPSDATQQLCLHPDGKTVLVVTQEALHRLEGTQISIVEQADSDANRFVTANFSTDGQLLATGHADGSIQVRPWESEGSRSRLVGHQTQCSRVWFLDRDRILVSSSFDETLRFWDISSGRALGSLKSQVQANLIYPIPERNRILTYWGNNQKISAWHW